MRWWKFSSMSSDKPIYSAWNDDALNSMHRNGKKCNSELVTSISISIINLIFSLVIYLYLHSMDLKTCI